MKYSIVIPAYNEKERLSAFVRALVKDLKKLSLNGEIIIVDDGSAEEHYRSYLKTIEPIKDFPAKVLRHPRNMGKGAAIQTGFKAAAGDWIGFVDADGATSSQETTRLLKVALASSDLDGVFGSRIRMLGYDIERRFMRHFFGRFFVTFFYILTHIPIYDSQCGCKFFRKSKIMPLLKDCKEQGYVFDTELISIGYFNKLNFLEVPISWKEIPGGKVHLLRDSFRMAIGIWRIKKYLVKMGLLRRWI